MSIIQDIRDKYARWAVVAIALSLLGFILMDAFSGRGGMTNGPGNTLGKVNGIAIDRREFDQKIREQESAALAQGYQLDDQQRQQLSENMWTQEVSDLIMAEEYEELGLTVTEKELRDIIFRTNPPDNLRQQFTDQATGQFNSRAAEQSMEQEIKDPSRKQQWDNYFEYVKDQRLMAKYMALMTNTVYYPKWFLEKRNVDNSFMGKISYVMVPYTTIPDSSVKISDAEIRNYMEAHRDIYEQDEETRSIDYVMFSAAPSSADTAAVKEQVATLVPKFAAAKDPTAFATQQGSSIPYNDVFISAAAIQSAVKDSLTNLPVGGVFGPYLEGNTFVIAKMVDKKVMPDSAKVKHILIQTNNPQTGQALLSDSVAKAKIDSIRLAIDRGANFDTLAKRFSADTRSAEKGGLLQIQTQQDGPLLDYFTPGQMVRNFNDSVFFGRVGERKLVKTEYGYHLIHILDLKNIEPHYKIAYVAKPIFTSTDTDQEAHNEANQFAGDSRDRKSFTDNFNKNLKPQGKSIMSAPNLKAMSYGIPGMAASSRQFIKKVFEADEGDVLTPERIGDNYVVAVVTEVNEPGLPNINTVRGSIEPLLRDRKKAEQIIKNIGTVSNLETVSTKTGQPIQSLDSVRFGGGQTLGYEPKVLGAIFNPANKGKVIPEPIAGASGVFVIRVDNVTTVPVEAANIEEQRRMMEMQVRQSLMQDINSGRNPVTDPLRKAATIKDYRADFF